MSVGQGFLRYSVKNVFSTSTTLGGVLCSDFGVNFFYKKFKLVLVDEPY